MLIQDLFSMDPRATWLYLERTVNDGSPSGYEHKDMPQKYRPPDGEASFERPCIYPSSGKLTAMGQKVPYELGAGLKFPLHPVAFNKYLPPNTFDKARVIPTSSARTVFIYSNHETNSHCLKLDYPDILGRFPRLLDFRRVSSALRISQDLDLSSDSLSGLRFMAEPSALLWRPRHGDHMHEVGCLVRAMPPELSENREKRLIPVFSLFSTDSKRPNEPPILWQYIGNCGGGDYCLLDNILIPIIKSWATLAVQFGHLSQWNSQNLLLLLSSDESLELIFRELQGTYCDSYLRPSHLPPINP